MSTNNHVSTPSPTCLCTLYTCNICDTTKSYSHNPNRDITTPPIISPSASHGTVPAPSAPSVVGNPPSRPWKMLVPTDFLLRRHTNTQTQISWVAVGDAASSRGDTYGPRQYNAVTAHGSRNRNSATIANMPVVVSPNRLCILRMWCISDATGREAHAAYCPRTPDTQTSLSLQILHQCPVSRQE